MAKRAGEIVGVAESAGEWTFLRAEGVEPTNNAAERALRRAVLWRRKSFGTQSAAGQPLRRSGADGGNYLTAAGA
jgi:hypothetical protein